MGPTHRRKSTSVRKARSVKPSTKPHPSPQAISLPDIGKELRDIVIRLERVESYTIVARMALEEACDQAGEVGVLLQRAVGDLLFKQIRALQDLAAQCDGGPPSDRDHEDEPEEDDRGEL